MPDSAVEQVKKLATSGTEDGKHRYKTLCDQRDAVLARAVLAIAQSLLEKSRYRDDSALTPAQNYQQAMKFMEEYLIDSSISDTDQDLLALVGTKALVGWALIQAQEEDAPQVYRFHQTEKEELDPVIVHRLAKALDRSPDQERLLRQFLTGETASLPDGDLVTAAIHLLLSDTSIGEAEEDLRKTVLDSILGG